MAAAAAVVEGLFSAFSLESFAFTGERAMEEEEEDAEEEADEREFFTVGDRERRLEAVAMAEEVATAEVAAEAAAAAAELLRAVDP